MESSENTKIFVGGISWETNEKTLRDHFSKYGDVVDSVIMKDRNTGKTRGFGFVLFSDAASADNALQDKHVILGRTVDVKKAIPRGDQHQHYGTNGTKRNKNNGENNNNNGSSSDQCRTKKLFVGGLPSNLTEEGFKGYFEKFGTITDVVVMYDSVTHRPRGFGFITFDSEEAVDNVMQNSFHELNDKLVEVKRAVPKDDNFENHSDQNSRMTVVRGGYMYSNNYGSGTYSSYGPWFGIFPGYMPSSPFASYGNGRLGVYPTPSADAFGSIGGYGAGYPLGSYGGIPQQAAGYGAGFANGPAPRSAWNGGVSPRQNLGPFLNPVYPHASSRSPSYVNSNRFASASFHNPHGLPSTSNGKWDYSSRDQKANGQSIVSLVTESEAGKVDQNSSSSMGTVDQNEGGSDT